jgi:hypothetical protein
MASMDEHAIRLGQNEVLFREVNERLRELGEGFGAVTEEAEFVCECGNTACIEHVRMALTMYEAIRADPKRFFVIKGHEDSAYEQIISENDRYYIVEKLSGGPAGLAIRDDPRS